jgi:peroxiredoxin
MTIAVGQKLPEATFIRMGANGPEEVKLSERAKDRKIVLFGLPGAYTGICTSAHVPSFIRTKAGFDAKGVDEILCVAVNDPFVMRAWGESTGAAKVGITMLADADGAYTKAVCMDFSNPAVGFSGRSKRYALYAVDGVVKVLHAEENPGVCDVSGGEAMLEAI